MFTRFHDDPARIKKGLQQSTDPGRYMLNVPGPGDKLPYMDDPYIRLQRWGANLRTNACDIESELLGYRREGTKGGDVYNYAAQMTPSSQNYYEAETSTYTEQSRAIAPAWEVRDIQQYRETPLLVDPKSYKYETPFLNNLETRILEKDAFDVRNR